jgi:hypothetical protein
MLGAVDKIAVKKRKGKYRIDSAMHFLPKEWRCVANEGEYFIYIRFFGEEELATKLVGERFEVYNVSMIGIYDSETEYGAGTMLPIAILSYDTEEPPHVKEIFDYMEWKYDDESIGSTFR